MASLRVIPRSSRSATAARSADSSVEMAGAGSAPRHHQRDLAPHARAAHAASSASPPRRTSSWVLVSSRHTAPGRSSPNASAIAASVGLGAVGRLEEHHRALLRGQSSASRRARSPALRGRNPSKQNRSTGSPDTASAVSTARRPGHGGHGHARLDRGRHQPVARVGDRSACPRRSPAAPARRRAAPRASTASAAARCPRSRRRPGRCSVDAEVGGQPPQPPGVLGGDDVGLRQLGREPWRGVADPADRRGGEHQDAGHDTRLAAS